MIKLIDIHRLIKNYVTIKVSGGFPERFVNLCAKEQIYLWDSFYEKDALSTNIYCKDFFKLRKIRRKSGVKIKITGKYGVYFFYKSLNHRKAAIYGFALSLLFMSFMNLFVWSIDIKGAQNISSNEILEAVNNMGLDYGTFVPLFDESESARETVNLFNGRVLWVAINIKGSKATVEIRESDKKDAVEEDDINHCNIIADFDGIIVSAEALSGVLSTKNGSAVKKGDLLVSGISENLDGSVNLHKAKGKLTAYHCVSVDETFDKKQKCVRIEETSRCNRLVLFSLNIPVSVNCFIPSEEKLTYTNLLKINGSALPFGIIRECLTSVTEFESNENHMIYCVDKFSSDEYERFRNTYVINSEYTFSEKTDGANISAEYECIDYIGKKSIIFEEN